MTSRAGGRVTPCTTADARARQRKAQSFATGAELVLELGEETGLDLPAVAAAAVRSGRDRCGRCCLLQRPG